MTTVTFDTLKYAEALKTAGVPDVQAKAQAEALVALRQGGQDLATKADITELRMATKADLAEVRADIAKLHTDLAWVRWIVTGGVGLYVLRSRSGSDNHDGPSGEIGVELRSVKPMADSDPPCPRNSAGNALAIRPQGSLARSTNRLASRAGAHPSPGHASPSCLASYRAPPVTRTCTGISRDIAGALGPD